MPIASDVPRVSDAEQHAERRPDRQDQPAGRERAQEEPGRRQVAGAPSMWAMAELATAPAAKSASTNGTSTMPSAASLAANTCRRPGAA